MWSTVCCAGAGDEVGRPSTADVSTSLTPMAAVDSEGGESLSMADDDDSVSALLDGGGSAVTRDDAVDDWKMTLSALSDVLLLDSSPKPLLMLLLLFSLAGRPTDADRCGSISAAGPPIAGDGGAVTLTGVDGCRSSCETGIARRCSTSGLSVAGSDSRGDVGGGGEAPLLG